MFEPRVAVDHRSAVSCCPCCSIYIFVRQVPLDKPLPYQQWQSSLRKSFDDNVVAPTPSTSTSATGYSQVVARISTVR